VETRRCAESAGINRKRPFSDRYLAIAEEVMPEKLRQAFNKVAGAELLKPGATWGDCDAYAQFLQTFKGNVNAAREIADRVEGKPSQRLEITGPKTKIVTIRIISRREKRRMKKTHRL